MPSHNKYFKLFIFLLLIILGVIFYRIFFSKKAAIEGNFSTESKPVILNDEGISYWFGNVKADTVGNFLKDNGVETKEDDFIFPGKDAKIYSGSKIIIERNKKVLISVDGKKIEGNTLGTDVAMALWDSNVKLGEDDFSIPSSDFPLKNNTKVEVVRVDIKEEIVKKEIDFEKQTTEDDKLSWRTKKVSQKGVKGIDEYKYKVVSHNGKEISRKLLSKERIKDPTPEISVQGTYMKLGKANKGQGTWYAWKGGLFAASTNIPRGAYVKVTNSDNGKTVVVQINDYGPQGKGRIIDLDKIAFEKIASLGAGVINVKVEQVLN
jgi:uncharacterized protein YabE (DUF348 family)